MVGLSVAGQRSFSSFGPAGEVPGADTVFEIGSITKALTGTLLANASERGELRLNDPISLHLPPSGLPIWRSAEPTLLDLATHRSGLPNTPGPLSRRELAYSLGIRKRDPWAELSAEEYFRMVRSVKQRGRGRARYSSLGFGLLGDALSRAAGNSYESVLSERILRPLGMGRSGFSAAEATVGRSRRGDPRPPLQDLMPAAGSVRSSAADMLNLLETVGEGSEGELGAALRLATSEHAGGRGAMSFGLGWMLLSRRGRPTIAWHNGGTWGFRSFAAVVPGGRASVVVLSNTTRSVDRLGFELIESL